MVKIAIIGFTGSAYSGKDTAAAAPYFGNFTKLAFASPLKEAAAILYNLTSEQLHNAKEVVDIRYNKSPRQILQELGTYLRDQNPNFFCDLMNYSIQELRKSGVHTFVITDIRHDNEAQVIKNLGGYVIALERQNKNEVVNKELKKHSSEQGIRKELVDANIRNDISVDNLHKNVREILNKLDPNLFPVY